jgi:peroxiredoxin Q/BCP
MLIVGDKAPAFKATDQYGKTIELSDFPEMKVILFFYPQDNTPTCTQEACNLRDNFLTLRKMGFVILGVSPQDVKSHAKFSGRFNLPFSLLADPDRKITTAYGCWSKKKLFGYEYMGVLRTTFIINGKGLIEKIIRKVRSKKHSQQILESYSA